MNVLLVSNDSKAGHAIVDTLVKRDHLPRWCRLGSDALDLCGGKDLVLLDLLLPDMHVLDLLGRLRKISTVPVLVLGTDIGEPAVVRILDRGADGYVLKPVRMRELTARAEALRRRAARAASASKRTVCVDGLTVDLPARKVVLHDTPVAMTPLEFELLAILARSVGTAVNRRQIMQQMWGTSSIRISRRLDVHMATLRNKLRKPTSLRTVPGVGYCLG